MKGNYEYNMNLINKQMEKLQIGKLQKSNLTKKFLTQMKKDQISNKEESQQKNPNILINNEQNILIKKNNKIKEERDNFYLKLNETKAKNNKKINNNKNLTKTIKNDKNEKTIEKNLKEEDFNFQGKNVKEKISLAKINFELENSLNLKKAKNLQLFSSISEQEKLLEIIKFSSLEINNNFIDKSQEMKNEINLLEKRYKNAKEIFKNMKKNEENLYKNQGFYQKEIQNLCFEIDNYKQEKISAIEKINYEIMKENNKNEELLNERKKFSLNKEFSNQKYKDYAKIIKDKNEEKQHFELLKIQLKEEKIKKEEILKENKEKINKEIIEKKNELDLIKKNYEEILKKKMRKKLILILS